jgi:hypothetical protein
MSPRNLIRWVVLMEWLTHNLIVVAVIVLAAYVVHLLDRVKRLEKPAENSSRDLVDAVNRMAVAILRPDPVEVENIKADDTHAALELIDHYIGYRLFKHTPALRRVLSFSIGVSLDFLREKTGITVTDLKGLEQYFSGDEAEPKAFWPAMSMVIEEWATHTVITDFSGRRDVIYPDYNFGHYSIDPRVIWKHALPGTRMFNFTVGGNLEIVLYHGSILFWARDGRLAAASQTAKQKTNTNSLAFRWNRRAWRNTARARTSPTKIQKSESPRSPGFGITNTKNRRRTSGGT